MIIKGKARRFVIQALRHYRYTLEAVQWHHDNDDDAIASLANDEGYLRCLIAGLEKEEHEVL